MNFFEELWNDVFTLLVLLGVGVWVYMRYKKVRAKEVISQVKELGDFGRE